MPGIYVHIPYCRRKCLYCDFYSVGSRGAQWEEYVEALEREARVRVNEWAEACAASHSPHTLYIGGGTPSQMPARFLSRLIDTLLHLFEGFDPVEATIEVNPEDVTPELAGQLASVGINRVSMGVQSFQDEELRAVGRSHSAACALEAYEVLRRSFTNVSIDLMFGLPLQGIGSWRQTLRQAVALRPEHISAYSLMWEERTALTKMLALGKVSECDEDVCGQMFADLTATLAAAGYEHYEISNYCKPGYRSVHNSSYWVGEPYIGLGAGAHSYDGAATRRANPADVKAYIRHFSGGSTPAGIVEHLSEEELHEEYVMTRLRRREGIDLDDYALHFGPEALRTLTARAAGNPLFSLSGTALRLTPDSVMRSDSAILALI